VSQLVVWMYGAPIGTLSRRGRRLTFTYSEEALRLGLNRPLLSVSMPTRPRPYAGQLPFAFFEGLLPEGQAREMIAYDFGLATDDAFGLLEALGRDCAGALVIVPDGETPATAGAPDPIDEVEIGGRLRNLALEPLGVDKRVRVSLAGMQRKLLLARTEKRWGLPVDGAPSTHLLKPPHHLLRHAIANESLCMRTAKRLGIPVADVEIHDFDGVPALVIERYDRIHSGASVARLHQEDFCQAHGLDGQRKYEEKGGPSLRRCAETIEAWSVESGQLEQLLDLLTANVLLGNADAHAKNLSLIHTTDDQVRLAPAYDLMCTVAYEVSTSPGMFINRRHDINAVTRDDLIEEARSWGLSAEIAAARVEALLSRAEQAVETAGHELGSPDYLVELLRERSQSLAAGLELAQAGAPDLNRPNLSEISDSAPVSTSQASDGPAALDSRLS
jgi:serine/threonine-protein kinase HipA